MNDLMLFACIFLWKADFSWGREKQIGAASKLRRNKIKGVNEKAKDSHYFLQASITKCQPFSFGAKIFLTDDAACLSRNI